MLYKLQEGLDEEGRDKFNIELERSALRIQHPLSQVKVEPPTGVPAQPAVKERKPPPGWKSEKEAFNNAMALMNFAGKRRGK